MQSYIIHFIRHGMTKGNVNGQYVGVLDIPVCEEGIKKLNDLKNNLERELKENKEEDISKNYFMEFLKILINHVDEKRETYNSILKNDKNGIVMDFLIDVSYRDLTSRLKNNNIISIIPIDVITKFYIGGIVNIGIDWVKNKNKYTKEELLLYFDKLIPDKV